MDSEKTQKAAQLMRKDLEDIVKNKEELIFYSASLLNQLRRVRKQLRNTKDELMAFQNKQAASCVCFNHKVAPDRVSMCLQEVKNMSAQAKGYASTMLLPKSIHVQKKANPSMRDDGKAASVALVDDDDTDKEMEEAPLTKPKRKARKSKPAASKVGEDDTDKEMEEAPLTKPKRKARKSKPAASKESEDDTDEEMEEAPLTKPKRKARKSKPAASKESEDDDDEISETFLTSDV
jgi:hypothetical protein